jgi:hypothetical protein
VPLKIRQRLRWKTVVTRIQRDDTPTMPTRAEPALVKALA